MNELNKSNIEVLTVRILDTYYSLNKEDSYNEYEFMAACNNAKDTIKNRVNAEAHMRMLESGIGALVKQMSEFELNT